MKRKFLKTVIAVCAATMMFGMTALAAPQKMPDGGTFDPQFYAQTYPDVAAALGTDPNALYQHYKTYGQKEGRQPYDPAANAEVTGVSQPTVVSVKQYGYGMVLWGATPLITSALSQAIKNETITVQTRSDGILVITTSDDKNFMDVCVPIKAPYKDANGKDPEGKFYLNSVASMGANSRVWLVSDVMLGLLQYGTDGPSGYLVAKEVYLVKQ